MVSATNQPLYSRERALLLTVEAGWPPGLFWMGVEGRKPLAPTGFVLRTLQLVANLCTDYAIPVHLLISHHLYCYFRRILENNFLRADFLNMTLFGYDCKIFYYRYFVIDLQNKSSVSLHYHSTNAPYSSSPYYYTYERDKPAKRWNLQTKQYSFTLLGASGRREVCFFFLRVKCLNSY